MAFSLRKLLDDAGNDVKHVVARPASTAQKAVSAGVAQLNPLDGNRTASTVMQKGAAFAPQLRQSAFKQLYHNGLVQSAIEPVVGFGKAAINTPAMIAADVTNNPVAQANIRQRTFGTNNDASIAKKIVGNTVGTGLTFAIPELKGAGLGIKAAAGAGIGAGFNASSALADGVNTKGIVEAGALGAALGGVVPVAGRVVSKVAPKVANKAALPQNALDLPSGFDAPSTAANVPKDLPQRATKVVQTPATVAHTTKLVPQISEATTSLAKNTPKLPVHGTKQVSGIDKAFRSTRSNIERQGEHGKVLGGLLQKSRDDEEIYQGQLQKQLPTVRSLKGKNFENFVEATQGKAKALNPKVEQAVKEWQAVHPGIRQRAVDAGLDVGDLGKQYYPHFIDYDKLFKDKNTYNDAINHLVESGQAPDQQAAIKLLGYAKDVSRNRTFGNLESERTVDLPMYDKTPNSLMSYIGSSTKRISQTENFGAKDEKALDLISKAGQQGFDTQAMKEAYDVAVGAKRYGQTATNVSQKLRNFQSTTRLGLGALTNVGQNVNTGIVTGHLRTMTSAVKQLSPATRSFVQDTGVISDAVLNDLRTQTGFTGKVLGHITAPGFAKVETLNRSIAATAGRDYALRLAQRGKTNVLRKLGVTGDITGKTLTEAQQIQAARKVVEKTQFKVDPQDLPGWADSPGGKLVTQFRTFSYAQGKFVSNEILKPAAKGNFLPLGRLLASLPVGYGLYEAKRRINGRPEEDTKSKRNLAAFQNVGGAGLVFDTYQSLNPPNSKYTPSDRRVSMALGTLAGPTAGFVGQVAGAASDLIQKKNTPIDPDKLKGKVVVANNGTNYTDATQAARLALNTVPIVGSPIRNRVLPYKKQSEADTGTTDQQQGKPGPFEAVQDIISKVVGGKKAAADSKDTLAQVDKAITDKKTAQVTYKKSFSPADLKMSSLDKLDRQKLIKQGVTTQAKLDGLDAYAKDQKVKLGLATDTSEKGIAKGLDATSKKTILAYNSMTSDERTKASSKQSDFDYKYAAAKYANDKSNGKLSTTQDIKAQDSLAKLKAGSSYDKETRDLYGLSNADLYQYVSNNKNGKAIADKVIAYGDALTKAGVQAKNKFRNSKGDISLVDPASKSSSSKSKKGGKLDYSKQLASNSAADKALRSLINQNHISPKRKFVAAKVKVVKKVA